MKENVDTKAMQSYLVPTPLAVASSAPCSLSSAKPGVPPDRHLSSKPHFTSSSNKPHQKHNQKPVAPQVPLEVNVVVPPSTKTRDYSVRTTEGLPRGPLSYEALVHLRRSASAKKTPLCPTVDHTVDLDKRLPATVEGPNLRNLPRSDRSDPKASKAKTGPPVVAPKPKKIPAHLSVKKLNEASIPTDSSYNVENATDPKVVKMEALQKLGLLKHQKPETETAAPLSAPKSHASLDPTPKRLTRGPSNPLRSPSFCYSQVPTESKNKLQSNASFHHYSRHDQQPLSASHPAQSCGLKAAGLERSATLDHHRNGGNCQPVPRKPSNLVAYTVMVVPGMGADRKEALRKLGLLKD